MNTPIYTKLLQLEKEERIPFHMPGHKRKDSGAFFNIEKLDITEITDCDNLHHPEGIIQESMNLVKDIFHTRKSWYLVGGSTLGIFTAISAVCRPGDKILIGRNCHKAVYNCIRLLRLEAVYCYPDISMQYDISKDVKASDVKHVLDKNRDVRAVVITSPTYEGVVSDIREIKKILPSGVPMIVDEAHGAHLAFHEYFPESAVECGADLVIQSTHKTLPSFTQTALLHLCSDLISPEKIEDMLDIYETSSPSYLLLASAEYGVMFMHEKVEKVRKYVDNLRKFRRKCEQLQNICLIDRKKLECYAYDPGKLVFSVKGSGTGGKQLFDRLYSGYHIELEMENLTYGIAMTSVCDGEEDFEALWKAVSEIDRNLRSEPDFQISYEDARLSCEDAGAAYKAARSKKVLESWECEDYYKSSIPLSESVGKISGKYVMIYPPGIPALVPGEKIMKETVENISNYLYNGYNVLGLEKGKIVVLDGRREQPE